MRDMDRLQKQTNFVQIFEPKAVDLFLQNKDKIGYVKIFCQPDLIAYIMSFVECTAKQLKKFKYLYRVHLCDYYVYLQILWVDNCTKNSLKFGVVEYKVRTHPTGLLEWTDSFGETSLISV